MQLYRYSPIDSEAKLMDAIRHIHAECHRLCRWVFGESLEVAGNIAVFCHYDEEYEYLTRLRQTLCHEDRPAYGKYYRLHEPLHMAASEDAPAATYTHLYIRRPDPYRHHVGDVDFLMPAGRYAEVRASLLGGAAIRGLRVYEPQTTNMLELHDPDSDALGYIVDTPLSASIPN